MVKYEERDVFMSTVHQQEIRERMETDEIDVPHLFVDGQYIGVSSTQRSFLQFAEARKSRLIDGGKIELEWNSGMCGSLW